MIEIMIPTECKMPDLADCSADGLKGRSMLSAYFLGDPGVTTKGRLYRRNYVRLFDKAVYEYQMARQAILAQIAEAKRTCEQMVNEGRQIYIFRYTDHLENCINAINRALRLFERLKSEVIIADLPREIRKSLAACSRSLPDVRNTFEHIDDEIREDRLIDGQPIMLSIGNDGDRAVIGKREILFVDLARTLRKLHEIGQVMFEVERLKPSTDDRAVLPEEDSLEQ